MCKLKIFLGLAPGRPKSKRGKFAMQSWTEGWHAFTPEVYFGRSLSFIATIAINERLSAHAKRCGWLASRASDVASLVSG